MLRTRWVLWWRQARLARVGTAGKGREVCAVSLAPANASVPSRCFPPSPNLHTRIFWVQGYGLGTNALTEGQKSGLIYGSLAAFFVLFLLGYALP